MISENETHRVSLICDSPIIKDAVFAEGGCEGGGHRGRDRVARGHAGHTPIAIRYLTPSASDHLPSVHLRITPRKAIGSSQPIIGQPRTCYTQGLCASTLFPDK